MPDRNYRKPFRTLTWLSAVSVAGLILAAQPSWASPPSEDGSSVRYERKSNKKRVKPDLLDTRFEAEQRETEKQRERDRVAADGRDYGGGTGHAAVTQAMADKQIEFLKKLIKTSQPTDPDLPDYLFRLADHYLEKKAYFDLQAGSLYEPIFAAEDAGDAATAKQLRAKQKRHLDQAKEAAERATRVYGALADDPNFAGYKRLDEALYYYAFELGTLGDEHKMQQVYTRLINDFPSSPYLPNAYLAFADYYYGKGQIGNAVRLYERVTQFTNSPVYAYALYKLAWCHLNPIGEFEARYDKSLNYFVETIDATLAGRAGSEGNAKQLRRDARRDLVRAYVHASKPSKAWKFFQKVGNGPKSDEQDARKMMELLANQYFGEGKYTESTYVYKQLQGQFEGDPEGCAWQGKIVINTLATDDKDIQWQESERLASFYKTTKASDASKTVKKQCKDNTLATLQQMATVWHDEADKTQRAHTYELAASAYQTLLATFPGDPDSYEMQYFYAELLWSLATQAYDSSDKRERQQGLDTFLAAHDEFVATLKLDPEGKHTVDAALAQMLAMKNHLEYDETAGAKKSCTPNSEGVCVYETEQRRRPSQDRNTEVDAAADYPVSDYSDTEQKMLDAYDLYTKYVDKPDDPELPKILYHRAKLMVSHNRFDEAEPVLAEMISKFDDVEGAQIYAAWCSAMLLDLLTIRWLDKHNDFAAVLETSEALEHWATKLQGMKLWNHPEAAGIRKAVPTLLMGIGWRKGEAQQQAGAAFVEGEEGGDPEGFEKCAAQFIDIFNTYADHEKADTLLWNAAECSDAAYRVGDAIQVRAALLEQFPDSKHAKDTLHYLANSYQAVAYYDDAADRFEQFADEYDKDDRASDALQNAYLFRLGLGQEGKAKDNLAKYESLYKRRDVAQAAKIFWSQHELLDSATARRAHAKEYLDTYGTRGGVDRAVVAEAVIGQVDWRRACDEPLLHDSCITVKRKKNLTGRAAIEEYKRLAKQAEEAEQNAESGERKRFKPPQYCGSPTQGLITVHRRSKKRSDAAQARFARVLKLVSKKIDIPEGDPKRLQDFRNAWAMAMVYQADQKFEKYLRIKMPEELDFVVEHWLHGQDVPAWERKYEAQVEKAKQSRERVGEFFTDKMDLGRELQDRYTKVTKTGSPYWVLAAAARTASVMQNFADQLYRAKVPQDFKTQEQVWAYCDELGDKAREVEQQAIAAYEYCIARSTEFQFFNDFSRLCEEEMQQRDATAYPATNELFGVSIYTDSRIDRVDVIEDPLGGRINPVKRKQDELRDAADNTSPE